MHSGRHTFLHWNTQWSMTWKEKDARDLQGVSNDVFKTVKLLFGAIVWVAIKWESFVHDFVWNTIKQVKNWKA